MKRAAEVLARRNINSRLAAYGGINLREERGRNLREINAAHINRSREARHIARYAAAESDYNIASRERVFGEKA